MNIVGINLSSNHKTKKMSQLNLLSLPPEILHIILVKACNNSLVWLCGARMTSKSLNTIGSTDNIYKDVDVMVMPQLQGYYNQERFDAFLVKCYDHHNPSAIYMRGMVEYFRSKMPEGLDKIKAAANAGYDLATYTSEMLQLILTAGEDGTFRHHPTISRHFCRKMRQHMCRISYSKIVAPLECPPLFDEQVMKILDNFHWCEECNNLAYYLLDVTSEREPMGNYSYLCHTDYWKLEVDMFWNNITQIINDWPGLWALRD